MNLKKILAMAAASTIAVTTLAFSASAESFTPVDMVIDKDGGEAIIENLELAAWGCQWVKSYDESIAEKEAVKLEMVVEIPDAGSKWDGFEAVFFGSDADKIKCTGLTSKTEYTFNAEWTVGEDGGIGFNIQAGQADIIVKSLKVVGIVGEDEEPTPVPPTDENKIVVDGTSQNLNLVGKKEDWGISGNGYMHNISNAIITKLGLTEANADYVAFLQSITKLSAKVNLVNSTGSTTLDDDKIATAKFYMQNQGGDWAWFDCGDELAVNFTESGELVVEWSPTAEQLSKLYTPVETWENYPAIGIQVTSPFIKADGDTAELAFDISEISIEFEKATEKPAEEDKEETPDEDLPVTGTTTGIVVLGAIVAAAVLVKSNKRK